MKAFPFSALPIPRRQSICYSGLPFFVVLSLVCSAISIIFKLFERFLRTGFLAHCPHFWRKRRANAKWSTFLLEIVFFFWKIEISIKRAHLLYCHAAFAFCLTNVCCASRSHSPIRFPLLRLYCCAYIFIFDAHIFAICALIVLTSFCRLPLCMFTFSHITSFSALSAFPQQR